MTPPHHDRFGLSPRQREALERAADSNGDQVTAQIRTMRSLFDAGLVTQPHAITADNPMLLTATLTDKGKHLLAEMAL